MRLAQPSVIIHANAMQNQSTDKSMQIESAEMLTDLDGIVGFHIRLAHGAVYRHFTETFSDLELTQKQVSVLWLIHNNPGVGQAQIGRVLQMDRATVMAIVNRLERRNFVIRKPSESDKRRQSLHLTQIGTEMFAAAKTAIADHEKWLKGHFTDEEAEQLTGFLRRIHK